MSVCKIEDDYVKHKLRWVAILSNHEVIYQDDYRPEESEPIAWSRLKSYLKINNLNIIGLKIQFCDNIVEVAPSHASGYYYVRGVLNIDGGTRSINFYTVGHIEDNKAYVKQWYVPAIVPMPFPEEIRNIKPNDDCVIINKRIT